MTINRGFKTLKIIVILKEKGQKTKDGNNAYAR